jgi:hypothetical protein
LLILHIDPEKMAYFPKREKETAETSRKTAPFPGAGYGNNRKND